MKLLCNACGRSAPPGSWSVIDGTLRLACAGCEVVAELPPRIAPAAAKREIDEALADFVKEPTPGPVAALAPAASVAVAVVPEGDDWLEQGWARLGLAWSDFSAHQRLIGEAAARNEFNGLGNHYRSWLASNPKDEVALKAREELIRKATAAMLTRLPAEEKGIGLAQAKRIRSALLLLFLAGVVAFGAWVVMHMGLRR